MMKNKITKKEIEEMVIPYDVIRQYEIVEMLGFNPNTSIGSAIINILHVKQGLDKNIEKWGEGKETGACTAARLSVNSALYMLSVAGQHPVAGADIIYVQKKEKEAVRTICNCLDCRVRRYS